MNELKEYVRTNIQGAIENGYWYGEDDQMSSYEIAHDMLEYSDIISPLRKLLEEVIEEVRKELK